MENQSENTKRIAKNTLMLYVRMLFGMLVSLYTSRVVLQALGVEDYGIYNVVGGVVGMLSVLNASMSGATSRFLAFELGRNDSKRLNETFSTALLIHIGIAILVLLLSETFGLWFLNHKLVIPDYRMEAAHIVFQFSIFSAVLSITQVPYDACIIAHEKMDIYAYIEILNVCLRLLIVYLLLISDFDKLILYSFLQFTVSFLIMMLYRYYSISRYKETKFKFIFKKRLFIPMLNFSGWDMFGNISMMIRGQGVNMLLNMFFGPAINAAAGVASSVVNATTSFSGNFLMAVKPYITKQYAKDEISNFVSSIFFSSKMAYLLVSLFSIPIIIECNFILGVWLSNVPAYAVSFCQLVLIQQIVASTSQPVIQAIHATARIKFLSVFNGAINILILPVSYIIFKYSVLDPNICYILNIVLTTIAIISNMWNLSTKIEFPLWVYVRKVVLPCYLSGTILLFFLNQLSALMEKGWERLFVVLSVYLITYFVISFYVVLDRKERVKVKSMILEIKEKWHRK